MSIFGAVASAIGGAALDSGQSILGNWYKGRLASKASGREYKYNARLAEEADERALNNAKALFKYQNLQGSKQLMQGYKAAGLNPVLAGDFNANMPSFGSHAGSVDVKVPNTESPARIGDIIDKYMEYRNMESQKNLTDTNAKAVAERLELNKQIAQVDMALKRAQTLTELEMPAKVRKEAEWRDARIMLNQLEADLIRSRLNVNAAQIEDLHSRMEYRRQMAKTLEKRSYIGLPFGLFRWYWNDPVDPDSAYDRLPNNAGDYYKYGRWWEKVGEGKQVK